MSTTAKPMIDGWSRASRRRSRHLPLAILITAYVAWFSALSLKMYYGDGYPPFDLAIFDQGLWLISHFHAPFVTVMGRNLFGDHTSFILLLVAPFYRLVPEPQGILVLQTLAIAATAVPIYLLAQKRCGSTFIATMLAATFLLNPVLQQGNMDQFHPEALQVLIIAWAIYSAVESRPVLLGVMVVLSLLVKEDVAALIVPLGIWVFCRRSRVWGYWIIGGALAWATAANEIIIPSILGWRSFYWGRIPFGGLQGFATAVVRRPDQVVSYLLSNGRPYYVWQLGLSAGWAFLLAPEFAALALVVVAENVISNDPYMHQILYQYSMPIVPVLVIATVFGVAAQKTNQRRVIATILVTACALWSSSAWGLAPFSATTAQPPWSSASAMGRAVAYVERGLPAHAVVAAWYPFVARIDHRTQVYVWPTPFSAENWGTETTTGQRLPVASRVQYLMLPSPLNSTEDPQVFSLIASSFKMVRSRDGVGLYEKISN